MLQCKTPFLSDPVLSPSGLGQHLQAQALSRPLRLERYLFPDTMLDEFIVGLTVCRGVSRRVYILNSVLINYRVEVYLCSWYPISPQFILAVICFPIAALRLNRFCPFLVSEEQNFESPTCGKVRPPCKKLAFPALLPHSLPGSNNALIKWLRRIRCKRNKPGESQTNGRYISVHRKFLSVIKSHASDVAGSQHVGLSC